jgi:hypothetical protein
MPQIKDLILRTEKVDWLQLKDLQPNNLKLPYYNNILKESLIKNNFAMPIAVWEDPKTNIIYICDGHTRRDTLIELKGEGYNIPEKLTCNFLDLANRKEAIQKLLEVYNTKKNPIDKTGMIDWIKEVEDIALDWLDNQSKVDDDIDEIKEVQDKQIIRVFLDCKDENEQEKIFNHLQELGYEPKIQNL